MVKRSRSHLALGLIVILGGILGASAPAAAQEQDFFSALFGGGRWPADPDAHAVCQRERFAGASRWCRDRASVMTAAARPGACEPATAAIFRSPASSEQGRAIACDSFCPASETKVVYGSSIDNASTQNGKSYSELPNAFRYRNEMVAGCTCNGSSQTGLAPVKIEDDPTLRKGDIVAGADGLEVAERSAGRRTAVNFSPASPAIQARYRSEPAVSDRVGCCFSVTLPICRRWFHQTPNKKEANSPVIIGSPDGTGTVCWPLMSVERSARIHHQGGPMLVSILVTFLVVILILYLINMLPLDGRAKQIARVVVIVLGVISLLKYIAVF